MQVKPAPRKGAGEGKRNEYQTFVKQENERVRLENPGANFGKIMSILGRDFKDHKRSEAEKAGSVNRCGAVEEVDLAEPKSLDFVIKKLDYLTL